MMYNNKVVACIKSNGKVLREFKDTVYVPFGEEYSILIKNLNSVRAQVKIAIDGQDVTDSSLIVNGNSEIEIERFIKNLDQGNRFKFIERTSTVENHRGVKVDDGLIRIEFQFERIIPAIIYNNWEYKPIEPDKRSPRYIETHMRWNFESDSIPIKIGGNAFQSGNVSGTTGAVGTSGAGGAGGTAGASGAGSAGRLGGTVSSVNEQISKYSNTADSNTLSSTSFSSNQTIYNVAQNDVGITVPGSISNQKFINVSSFPLEDEVHVIVLHMLGVNEAGKSVMIPVTVKSKPVCITCGHTNKAIAKFCINCGTSLILF